LITGQLPFNSDKAIIEKPIIFPENIDERAK
jgi:hypothetical protein